MTEEYTRFFRCLTCGKELEMNEWLGRGNCKCTCGGGRFSPTILNRFEVCKYLLTHPRILINTLWEKVWRKRQK